MVLDKNIIPDKVYNFHLYADDDILIGGGDEWTLPTVTALANELVAAGVGGKLNVPMPGLFESMEQGTPFTSLYSSVGSFMKVGGNVDLTIRGALQALDSSTSKMLYKGIVVTERGWMKEVELGKMKLGEGMDVNGKMEVTYLKIMVDGQELLFIDKLNGGYRVNGEDQMVDIDALL